MSRKEENGFSTNLRLTTIVYRKGEWSPELLQEDVRKRYMYCEIPQKQFISHGQSELSGKKNIQAVISEYADQLENTMTQNNIDLRMVLYIAATDASLCAAQAAGLAVLGYANSLSGARMVVEGFEEVDALFLERRSQGPTGGSCGNLQWMIWMVWWNSMTSRALPIGS